MSFLVSQIMYGLGEDYDFEWIDGDLRCFVGDADDCRAGQHGLVFEHPFSFLL